MKKSIHLDSKSYKKFIFIVFPSTYSLVFCICIFVCLYGSILGPLLKDLYYLSWE